MTKALIPALFAAALMAACEEEPPAFYEHDSDSGTQPLGPTVQGAATYDVVLESDITYAEGLGYNPRGDGTSKVELPLKLDVYSPDNNIDTRPVFMWIHGGGFTGGSKTRDDIEEMGAYFAARGWVFVSINYRTTEVLSDGYDLCEEEGAEHEEAVEFYRGIAPQEWTRYACDGAANRLNFHQSIAMYAAQRDARAALRWVVANADEYSIDPDYITVGGNSAGAITASTLGIIEDGAFRDEIPAEDDPTRATTNLSETYAVRSLVWFWGSRAKITLFGNVYGGDPYDAGDPELFMAHGPAEEPGESNTPYTESLELQSTYDDFGVHSEVVLLYCDGQEEPLCPFDTDDDGVTDAWGHGAWKATVDGKSLFDLSFDFVVRRQGLVVE